MIKEIAMYVNNFGEITDLNKDGFIKIFSKYNDKWNIIKEIPFEFQTIQEKEDIRLDTLNISEALENCKVFVAKEIPNLIYMMLDSIGVSTWKMDGNKKEILDYVLGKENEEAQEIKFIGASKLNDKKQSVLPIEIGINGYYILNLKEFQEHNTGITTKQVLKPFLKDNKFNELIVTCNHVPCWLEGELERLNLTFECSKAGQNDYIVIINHI
ncbi:iron only nitrogenase protein AnfO [Clostridium puniceum]|uniref:Iron only nitrogenase protein AnfO n=1 Tax=Clostridium puniceum TaxID=29367 RepID=A0A1S8TBK6_9CLOT|nr:Fe-only nitrogenase accessory AnfO family protein [Clostridium puniceum]OOM74815.1 iron only nitrogenase protein AnfO [Clostridium puniceum]